MIEVKRVMLSNYKCPPIERPGEISPFYIVENFEGSQTWFNLAVYLTNKCWRQFTQTCKYHIKADKAHPHAIATREKTIKSNVQMMITEDKRKARELLDEFKHYRKTFPEKLRKKWESIVPFRAPCHRIPSHWYSTPVELQAEELYRAGHKSEARNLMKEEVAKNGQK